jgi:hypothetical protein
LGIGTRGGIELLTQVIDFNELKSNKILIIPTLMPTKSGGKHELVS